MPPKKNATTKANKDEKLPEETVNDPWDEEEIPDPKESIKELLEVIKSGKEIAPNAGFKTLFLMMLQNDQEKRISNIEKKVETLEKELAEKNEIIDNLDSRLLMQEVSMHESKIIIRNLNLHVGAQKGKETRLQTRQVAEQVLKSGQLSVDAIRETHRIYYKPEKSKPAKCPSLILEFNSTYDLAEFMSKIETIKKAPKMEKIQVDRFIPPSLMPEFEKASKEAFSLRKKGLKTKIIVTKNAKMLLLAKGPKDEDFSKRDY